MFLLSPPSPPPFHSFPSPFDCSTSTLLSLKPSPMSIFSPFSPSLSHSISHSTTPFQPTSTPFHPTTPANTTRPTLPFLLPPPANPPLRRLPSIATATNSSTHLHLLLLRSTTSAPFSFNFLHPLLNTAAKHHHSASSSFIQLASTALLSLSLFSSVHLPFCTTIATRLPHHPYHSQHQQPSISSPPSNRASQTPQFHLRKSTLQLHSRPTISLRQSRNHHCISHSLPLSFNNHHC